MCIETTRSNHGYFDPSYFKDLCGLLGVFFLGAGSWGFVVCVFLMKEKVAIRLKYFQEIPTLRLRSSSRVLIM